jgi:hypothetical protein
MSRDLLNSNETARRLRITEEQLGALVHDGEISYINVGRGKKRPRRRFTEEDIAEFLERRRRREACQSISLKSRRTGTTTSGTVVIGFTAQRAARHARKPTDTNP